jgi:DNA-binding MarR family transcriptional regulator
MTRHAFRYDAGMSDGWLTASEQRAWRVYLGLHRELTARLNRQLQADSQLSLADYGVLVELSEAPDCRLRPYELAGNLQWEQSRLSHHVGRMQRRGLVSREGCTADGRGAFIVLTPCGRGLIEAAAPAHAAAVRELFFDALTGEQVRALDEISTRALDRLGATKPDCPSVQR